MAINKNMFWKRYIISFVITVVFFAIAFYLSGQLAQKKIDQVRVIQDKISTDILSTETRFILLGSSSCEHITSSEEFETGLTDELSEMARRVKFMENQLGADDERVILIKNQYSLFQIKDYLLHRQLTERCGETIPTILYFHSLDCENCREQSIVLDEIHNKYPSVRIYWLETDGITPALKTLISMFDIKKTPTIVVGDKTYEDFQSIDILSKIFDDLEKARQKKLDAINAKLNTTKTVKPKSATSPSGSAATVQPTTTPIKTDNTTTDATSANTIIKTN